MLRARQKPSISTSIISFIIIATLMLIAAIIFKEQFNFNPAVKALSITPDLSNNLNNLPVTTDNSDNAFATDEKAKELISIIKVAPPFEPMSAPEFFNHVTLSDKINGKAELYLPAGFKSLQAQRFKVGSKSISSDLSPELSSANSSNLWIEVFIYDMALPENAFSVFSRQRRQGAKSISISEYGYHTENAIFFAHGQFYVEMVASIPSLDVVNLMVELGRVFVNDHKLDIAPKKINIADIFPAQFKYQDNKNLKLDKDSITLIASDAFGFDKFNNIYTATYLLDNLPTLTAFISKRESPKEAADIAKNYTNFLVDFGANRIDPAIEGVYGVEIMDTIELIFSLNQYLAGVREGENIELSKALVVELKAKIIENESLLK
ncbi:MAG: hypothetical protein HQK74_04740 [Desulfamplus sp.]|nr:hypothetical protein [Desulfamplus sp.]